MFHLPIEFTGSVTAGPCQDGTTERFNTNRFASSHIGFHSIYSIIFVYVAVASIPISISSIQYRQCPVREMSGESEGTTRSHEHTSETSQSSSQPSQTMHIVEPLPQLHTPHRKRRLILITGVVLATLDLCCLPITYYYALKFDTSLSLQEGAKKPLPISNLTHRVPSFCCHYWRLRPAKLHALFLPIS